jgi:hypothetical protein
LEFLIHGVAKPVKVEVDGKAWDAITAGTESPGWWMDAGTVHLRLADDSRAHTWRLR